jgi:MGT family glycosyltransferase
LEQGWNDPRLASPSVRVLQSLIAFSGNAPPQLAVMRRLAGRGHEVRALAHSAARSRIEATGAELVPFRLAYPEMDLSRPELDPVRDWEPSSAMAGAARFRDRALIAPMADQAAEASELIASWKPDMVVFDFLLLGVAVAAERAGIPAVVLVHCPYPLPSSSVPPLGSGLRPGRGPLGRGRDRLARKAIDRFYRPVLESVNSVRDEFGLGALAHWGDQLLNTEGVFVLTAPELDFASRSELPPNVHFAGPAFEPLDEAWDSPWPTDDADPLIVVSFSSSYMDQTGLAQRVLDAVSGLSARVLLTAGPALDISGLRIPDNTRTASYVPHGAVLPEASLVITHAGWGTVNAALAAGVPLVCIPDGRDQPDNAARVVEAGAGVRVGKRADSSKLREVVAAALEDASLRQGAESMAEALGRRDGATSVVDAVEGLDPKT